MSVTSPKILAPKILARNLLLLFAMGSLVYASYREFAAQRRVPAQVTSADSAAPFPPEARLVVYYFSEGKECTTCEHIPEYTRAALEGHFKVELDAGAVVFRSVDVDEPANEHYIHDYGIYTKSVVIAKLDKGKQVRWKNLPEVWDRVYDKAGFVEYLCAEIRAMLDAAA